jgi:hypothetical protein
MGPVRWICERWSNYHVSQNANTPGRQGFRCNVSRPRIGNEFISSQVMYKELLYKYVKMETAGILLRI